MTDFDHWYGFSEFVRYETAVGGPDPQLLMVKEFTKDLDLDDKLWAVGTYCALHNFGGGALLFNEFPLNEALTPNGDMETWLTKHWKSIPFRYERRAVRSPQKLARYLTDYVEQSIHWPDADWWEVGTPEAFNAAWDDVQKVYSVGRYIAVKMLELLMMCCGAETHSIDIRAKGGWSPVKALSEIWVEHKDRLLTDKSDAGIDFAEKIATLTIFELEDVYGLKISPFQLQVLLCEYREAYWGQWQYPGESIDAELKHLQHVEAYWGADHPAVKAGYRVREALFDESNLGEKQGWPGGRRKGPGLMLAQHGQVWRDSEFDYNATLVAGGDWANPIRKEAA